MKENQDILQENTQPKQENKLTPAELRVLKRNTVNARRRRRQLLCWAIALVLVLIAAIPGYQMVYQPHQAKTFYRTMKNVYGQLGSGKLPAEYNQQLGGLYDINTDIGGWLIVPGSNINLPVAQTIAHDSVFYAGHLFDGRQNPYGTLYYINTVPCLQPGGNTVIRGGQQLLGELGGYRTLEFYQKAPLLFLDTLGDAAIFKVFAVVEVGDEQISRYTVGQFESVGAFYDYVTMVGENSVLSTGITVEPTDQLLTIICDTEQGKLAVVGRRVRADEDYTVDTSLARLKTPQTPGNVVLWDVTATDYETPSDVYATTPTNVVK